MLPSNPKIFSNNEPFSVFLYWIHFESTEIDEQPGHRGWITTQSCLKVMCIRHKHTCAHVCARTNTHMGVLAQVLLFSVLYCPSLFIPFPQSCSLSAYRFSLFPPLSSLPPLLFCLASSPPPPSISPPLFSLPPASKDAISVAELEGTCLMRWNNITIHNRSWLCVCSWIKICILLAKRGHFQEIRMFPYKTSLHPYKCEGLFEC